MNSIPISDTKVSDEELFRAEFSQLQQLAPRIMSNRELKRILLQTPDLEMREAIYKLLVPFLKFRVRPYENLMRL